MLSGDFLRVLFIKSKSRKKLTITLFYTTYHMHILVRRQLMLKLEMWANAQRDGRPTNIGGALCSTPQSLADAHY